MTPFEQAQQNVLNNKIKTSAVSVNGHPIDYFSYQLATHHFNLKIMAEGMTFKGIKLKTLKTYYGLTARNAKECLKQFEKIYEDYKYKNNLLKAVKQN